MTIRIGTNIASLMAQRQLGKAGDNLSRVYERLASGMRINSAGDDAAGLAIADALQASARIYNQGVRNLNDGISMLAIAEGALSELGGIVTRIQELSEQAANGVYSTEQRQSLDVEAQALSAEYTRIIESTSYNGLKILDGSLSSITLQGGYSQLTMSIGGALAGRVIGTGVLETSEILNGGVNANGQTIADLNGDGVADIAAIYANSSYIGVFIGNGNGTFLAHKTFSSASSMQGICSGDVNGDGVLDLVSSRYSSTTAYDHVFIGNGDGTFKYRVSYGLAAGEGVGSPLVDLNGDGALDIVNGGFSSDSIAVLMNNGDGTFASQVNYQAIVDARDPVAADFNNDGKADIVVAGAESNNLGVLLGNGNGSFQAPRTIITAGDTFYPAVGDVNSDGFVDIVRGDWTGTVDVHLGNGDGTFATSLKFSGVAAPTSTGVADFNGDGRPDILVTDYPNWLYLMTGNGDGTFGNAISFDPGTGADTLTIGDLNNDGVMDAVTGNFQNPGKLSVFITQAQTVGGLPQVDLTSSASALQTLEDMQSVGTAISAEAANIGAFQSRINVFISSLRSTAQDITAAAGRIMDADMAEETAALVRNQILQQSASAILAQANQIPSLAIRLLEGGT